jgi:hypothetical protein
VIHFSGSNDPIAKAQIVKFLSLKNLRTIFSLKTKLKIIQITINHNLSFREYIKQSIAKGWNYLSLFYFIRYKENSIPALGANYLAE